MPRTYKRKTDRVSTPLEELERAVKEVQQGKTIRQVGKEMKICRMTIKRHMDKKKIGEVTKPGYERTAVAKRVFNENMEKELADHIKTLAAMFHGIGVMKCRELAFEFAQRNSIDMPASWTRDEKAGPDWFNAFKARYHLACRVPEATSLGRATAFNKHNVGEFFDNLSKVKDRDIFPEEDYAPSMVTDRANPEDEPSATADLPGEEPSTSAAAHLPGEEPSTSAAAHLPGPSHEPTHVTDPDPGEPPATLTNPEHLSSDKSGSSAHLGYVSPEVILPLPKATERKKKCVRKKVKTRIVTDTPEKMELEKAHKEKEDKKAEQEKKKNEREKKRALKAANQTKTKKKTAVYSSSEESSTTNDEAEDGLEKTHSREKERAEKKKRSGNKKGALKGSKPTKPKKKVLSSSSEESDFPIPLSDTTHYESSDVQSDDDDGDKDLSAGDFVIVKFAGKKSKCYNYVGLVENVEGDEISAKFLKQSYKRSVDGKPIFTFRENDEGVIPRGDVLKKLPTPQKLGGTARREYKFTFPCSIDKWDVQ
ncbi:uncharacterized protein LOC117539414 isoform X2 [Gymnodraco acuticeps]|uniref:Uncharacterized protein LOC117539414 isoform X2 n=1 Tax=Gymnodraco acuticeps TaxID=8218 RepID=A0A6P8TCB6_GYMAC|nr:uncharacterized protein LOC117539414 isoform X2 [Gymnodraco acuticeps]